MSLIRALHEDVNGGWGWGWATMFLGGGGRGGQHDWVFIAYIFGGVQCRNEC